MDAPAVLRYPSAALRADYVRAAAGLALTLGPLALVETARGVAVVLAAAAALFAAFLLRTATRQLWPVRLEEDGVRTGGPLGATVRWAELRRLALRFYATRRDRTEGWMQLTLAGPKGRLTVESTLDGFDDLAARALEAARRNRLPLSETTKDNLLALGLDPEAD